MTSVCTASDDAIIAAYKANGTYSKTAKELNISRQHVSKVVRKYNTINTTITKCDECKSTLIMEITQENALSDLSNQMKQYTDNYQTAIEKKDEKAAYAWSTARRDLLEKMLKVTGLYNTPLPTPIFAQESVGNLSDEEVEARARAILRKRCGDGGLK
jgi:predicted transcriptional regulator